MIPPSFANKYCSTSRATELLPDAKGNRPNVDDMLANPRYLGQQIRFAVHNNLQQLGYWAVIEKFLQEVVKLDDDTGRPRATQRSERLEIMNGVAGMVEQAIEIFSTRVRLGILTDPKFSGFWLRKEVCALSYSLEVRLAESITESRRLDGLSMRVQRIPSRRTF